MTMVEGAMPSESLTVEQAIANLNQTDDPSLRYYAAWWLGRFRVSQPAAIAALVTALDDEADRSPDGGYPLRRNAARALGKLQDPSVGLALIQCLDCPDYYVREAAAQALGDLGDRTCIEALQAKLVGGVEAAVPVPGKPHLVEPYGAILETLGMLKATTAIAAIRPFLRHSVPAVQNSAARALYQLTGEEQYAEQLVTVLQSPTLQLRRSALMDLGAVGYLPAAEAIAATLAENSLKLIALKGLLDQHLTAPEGQPPVLSDRVIAVMDLMDELL
ncbi:HEAT repeat domain-containing protein [Leptolyngbya sp. PCC 6406]|uniref:HEAT repeat domain-containing protein n=1 Tax=Leptolyngbya sp. PCC 6406 TaxID=1173264 RepID=UPI0021F0C35B|nr:HEAT repeat domain-containing protein [Leptolyngbya sp. PCC 6406]